LFGKMKTSVLLLLLVLPLCGMASPAMVAPFPLVFADCEENYPKLADELLREIRKRVQRQDDARLKGRLESIEAVVARIKAKQIVDVRRSLNGISESGDVISALERLDEAILESRQTFDRLLIEAATIRSLTLDEALFARLQAFWLGVAIIGRRFKGSCTEDARRAGRLTSDREL
jgi:hypothetical protein